MARTHVLVGGAGFIGSNLLDDILQSDYGDAVVIDDLSRGSEGYIANQLKAARCKFIRADTSEPESVHAIFESLKHINPEDVAVWHFAANSDIPAGISDIYVDFQQTFKTTVAILSGMKCHGLRRLYFASSSAVYGNHGVTPLTEDIGNCFPISNYGAMKLASEAVISAACEDWLDLGLIFRFPNVIGAPATHGVIYDFISRLFDDSDQLTVMGDGSQQKSYLHVSDLISAMRFLASAVDSGAVGSGLQVFNIGPADSGVKVSRIAELVAELFTPLPKVVFGAEPRGWVGDVPKFVYDCQKLAGLGWSPSMDSEEAVRLAVKEIHSQLKKNAN